MPRARRIGLLCLVVTAATLAGVPAAAASGPAADGPGGTGSFVLTATSTGPHYAPTFTGNGELGVRVPPTARAMPGEPSPPCRSWPASTPRPRTPYSSGPTSRHGRRSPSPTAVRRSPSTGDRRATGGSRSTCAPASSPPAPAGRPPTAMSPTCCYAGPDRPGPSGRGTGPPRVDPAVVGDGHRHRRHRRLAGHTLDRAGQGMDTGRPRRLGRACRPRGPGSTRRWPTSSVSAPTCNRRRPRSIRVWIRAWASRSPSR